MVFFALSNVHYRGYIQHMKNVAKPTKKYKSRLNLIETEHAIKFIKDSFQKEFSKALNLTRVSAPLFVTKESGINDYLNGIEEPVSFHAKGARKKAEIVQSLAKWKRQALSDYGFKQGQGLYTDMNAIRPDEDLDNLHSLYVDQWDWEKIIARRERNIGTLKKTVRSIYGAIKKTEALAHNKFSRLGKPMLPEKIHFIHAEELREMYPGLKPKERERRICREKKAVFVMGIGAKLGDGKIHDGRAPDYDDWWCENEDGYRGLNGDILVWYPVLDDAFELSSMGIRVDATSIKEQLKIRKAKTLPYHKKLIADKLPLTMGGGIGQSRLCMFFMKKFHIGEIQASIWPDTMRRRLKKQGIELL